MNGFLLATTPSGHILHVKAFSGSESLSQRFFFLAEIAALVPELSLIIHDDSCHLRKFARKHGGQSELGKRLQYPRAHYVIDCLHIRGHRDTWCLEHCHPDKGDHAQRMKDTNTSRAEQVNHVVGRHKHSLRSMGRFTRSFFMNEIIDSRNVCRPHEVQRRLGEWEWKILICHFPHVAI